MEQPPEILRHSGRRGMLFCVSVLLVPVVYFLSFGPVFALVGHSRNPRNPRNPAILAFLVDFYKPVSWLHDHTLLKTTLDKYAEGCYDLFGR
ncbi:MAG TPA: hypothetical protein VFE51_29350 [Verrucomicrobiae bacterium]|nr:hypothetical protein [Verrucomicrobiae bacterium]